MDSRLASISLSSAARGIADLVMPRECLVCGTELLEDETSVCLSCLADLPLTYYWQRTHNPMADRFNEKVDADRYQYAAALFFYHPSSPFDRIPQALKYNRDFVSGRRFASMLGRRLAESAHFADVDLVIPVPLHFLRRLRRGYNQAEVIAEEVASALSSLVEGSHARVETGILRRIRRTKTQTRLSREGKRTNVSGAFSARRPEGVNPGHILLVDDVFTSGSTMSECSAALRSVFPYPTRISAASLCCVGE